MVRLCAVSGLKQNRIGRIKCLYIGEILNSGTNIRKICGTSYDFPFLYSAGGLVEIHSLEPGFGLPVLGIDSV